MGGVLGYSKSTTNNTQTTSVSAAPDIGYVNASGWVVGCRFGYSNDKFKNEAGATFDEQNSETFTLAPYLRRLLTLGEKSKVYVQGDVQYTFGSVDRSLSGFPVSFTTQGDVTRYGLSVGIGAQYALTEKVLLEASVGGFGYQKTSLSFSDSSIEDDVTDLGFDLDLSTLRIGFKYVVPSK